MIIKKYVAKTEAEATEAARKELGNGVVVMNVREVNAKGLFASMRPKWKEVTVALEGEQEKFSPLQKESVPLNRNIEKGSLEKKQTEDTRSIEEKLENLQNLLVSKLQNTEATEGSAVVTEKEQAAEEKGEEKENVQVDEKEDEYLRFLKLLYNMMVDNEVDERYANQIIDGLDKSYKPGQSFDHLLANVYQRLILKFGKTTGILPATEGPRVVLFFGPTGVGKTTTIAKLASHFSVSEKKQVAMLTSDTYRIAAAEQLRTYANILQVPFRVLYTEEELATAIKDFYQYDYIFIDTTGHSHQNEEQKENVKQLIHLVEELAETQSFLVLSATTKYKDLIKIVDNYAPVAEYELIFTKLDETYTLGNILNLRLHTGAAIAYVTNGQNVPEDIEVFDPQATVKMLLGGKK
ncbi:MAG: flagellar biosynthesis protein FlhF [Lachnospiraceae bacterium]|nr:flagellar biosynthesis protein FlhF [Lachnospiraceae bacterium]